MLVTLYLVVINQKNRIIITYRNLLSKSKKSACFNWMYGLSGNDYKVATLPKSYLIVIGIILQSLKSIVQIQEQGQILK